MGNSPNPADVRDVEQERPDAPELPNRRPGLVRHESLPSLHLNARCLKCDRVGTVYCKVRGVFLFLFDFVLFFFHG